ncbi:NUDIX domain-containing protein [Alkaliphilus peptidifermentans]|uniref:ADP-ribose pyrophosphatase YjhB, NUDIX family n=1 Tax=Alkaliphilus peptidifermentans DSM 18978 TaxID=1120976 RepID=A0A1G5GJ38_9FIRM|nr:NUDIX domain-containing protein [Alkaliphilus peptidifermentans]SCY51592.1 ADP-ribose pyrophosphatase YjhB, NUDIX family [Alkaliphilus peptidifermentans DSM 18978]
MEKLTGCCGIIVVKDNKLLLGLRTDGQGWGLAGGKLEHEETHYEAAKRELNEEFNIIPKELTFLGFVEEEALVKGEKLIVVPSIYLCEDYFGEPRAEPKEMKELGWFDADEIKELKLFPPSKAAIYKYWTK